MPFEEVYELYFRKIYYYVCKHIPHRQDCEDITADVFLSAFRNWNNYDETRCPLAAWLYLIASNRLKNYYRDKKKTSSLNDERISYNLEDKDYCDEAERIIDGRKLLAELLKSLNDRERKLIINKYFVGLSNEELAKRLEISSNNVRVICSRALKKMHDSYISMT